jgi:AAA domain
MSHREGHVTGGAAAPTLLAPAPSWEETYPALSPTQQNQLLDLANQQGYLLVDQVPTTLSSADAIRPFLQDALSNHLTPIPIADSIVPIDASLDVVQQDAVARALSTPDLFLLAGPTGTGKSRVAVEVVKQVIKRGGKVLLLSPEPAALDGLLPALSDLTVVRRLGPGESLERLSPTIAAMAAGRREALIRDGLMSGSSEGLAKAEQRVRKSEQLRTTWLEWTATREHLAANTREHASLLARQQSLPEEVRQEAEANTESPPYFVQRLRGVATAHARRVAALDVTRTELAVARSETEGRRRTAEAIVNDLKPKADALQAGRWLSPSFWKAKLDATLATRLPEATATLAAATTTLAELTVREGKLASDTHRAEEEYAAERARFLDAEVARRAEDLAARIADMEHALAVEGKQESALALAVREAGLDQADLSRVESECQLARQELEFASGWASQVEAHIDQLVREACGTVQVVAGPVAGIASDPTATANAPFDLLVIDDAHRLAEADFVAAGRLARRWMLIGEPAEVPSGRQRASRPDLFARLLAAQRHDIWSHEGPRLVCRLYPVRGAERKRLECEPVADAPDIELRLFTPRDGDPTLAEVAFPATTTPAAAREYLFRELGEVTCEPRTRSGFWEESASGPLLRFGSADPAAAFAAIGDGIREEIVGLETRAIHFGADWTVERAKEWAAENVGQRAGGRVVMLDRPYRACPGLACWLNRAFATGFAIVPITEDSPHVEFLAVPDSNSRNRRDHAPGRSTRVGGAGYEIDLADQRQRAALPLDMTDLPTSGFVNLPEAQALVRYLEPIAGQNLAVTSPFPAQLAVLRRLLARSPRLAHVPVLDSAEATRHECDFMAVSLTRSHVARAVPFGDGPSVLAALLGRARKKLLFAGDPGTLARRLQWEGPVDHLDAADAARERAWVAALADCPRVSSPRHRYASHESVRA